MKRKVQVMITAFRDGFQSAYGARVQTKDFLPAVEAAVEAGMTHLEAGGGARFQSLFFYCNENAFDMMDSFREAAGKEANLQTLARGVNVVGLSSQPRDIIQLHARLFKKHGMTTIRNFDALNDVNNLIYSGQCIKEAGLKHEVCVTMMELPPGSTGAHDPAFYTTTLRKILDEEIVFDSVCFKDASGTSVPSKVYETIKQARALLGKDAHIVFHSHETAGVSIVQYKAALEAGATQVDCSLAPVSGGTCQPDLMTMHHALKGTEFDLGIDPVKVYAVEEIFKECMADYFMPPEAGCVEPTIPLSPMPGGALTANTQMLRDHGLLDRYEEIAAGMSEVVAKGGYGTSVTPVSQFYFQQAFNNVMYGPWEKIAPGYGKMVLGYFGKTPVEPDPQVKKICAERMDLSPTQEIPVDINDRDSSLGVAAATCKLEEAGLPVTDENIFIAATCQEKGILFLQGKARLGIRKKEKEEKKEDSSAKGYTVVVNGNSYEVSFSSASEASVNGRHYAVALSEGLAGEQQKDPGTSTSSSPQKSEARAVTAPMPALVLRITKKEDAVVRKGDLLLVLEAMKMETPLLSPSDGVVKNLIVTEGDQVKAGQLLLEVG